MYMYSTYNTYNTCNTYDTCNTYNTLKQKKHTYLKHIFSNTNAYKHPITAGYTCVKPCQAWHPPLPSSPFPAVLEVGEHRHPCSPPTLHVVLRNGRAVTGSKPSSLKTIHENIHETYMYNIQQDMHLYIMSIQ